MRSALLTALAVTLSLAAAIALGGCEFPRDVEGTLDRVEGGTMRVGVVDNPPWVILGGREPSGIEPELVRQFAEQVDAEIEWVEGHESELISALEGFQLDVVIAGLTRGSPFGREVALTRPYVDTETEFAVPPGQELPEDLAGVRIWVERSSEAAALLQEEEEETEAIEVEEVAQVEGPALLETYYIEALGYERTDHILRDDEHCMAVPPGENAFLVELEKFLLPRGDEAEDLLEQEAKQEVLEQKAKLGAQEAKR